MMEPGSNPVSTAKAAMHCRRFSRTEVRLFHRCRFQTDPL